MNMRRWYYALAPPSIPIDAFIIATGLSLNGLDAKSIAVLLNYFNLAFLLNPTLLCHSLGTKMDGLYSFSMSWIKV